VIESIGDPRVDQLTVQKEVLFPMVVQHIGVHTGNIQEGNFALQMVIVDMVNPFDT